jgi:hypothetical protein
MTQATITSREVHTTRNGHTVELRLISDGRGKIVSEKFCATYADAAFARRIANIIFMELATGCYACALDIVGRTVMDTKVHDCGK